MQQAVHRFQAMNAQKDFRREARSRAARVGSPWKGSQPYLVAYFKVLKKYWFTPPDGHAGIDHLIDHLITQSEKVES